ncbi:MAG: prenyltransferase [Planctomycetota bacterium]|nr:MAG: prenyltransferase [Planctomycetota bacterium]
MTTAMSSRSAGWLASIAALALAALAAPQASRAQAPNAPAPARANAAPEGGIVVTPEQARAVERGLAWLASQQAADGSWSADIGFKLNDSYKATGSGPHVGVTALAGLAFLAAGHQSGRGEYGRNIDQSLAFLLSCSSPDGYITYKKSRMYSHAFATLFLAEAYGMSWRPDLRERLQRAVDFIVGSQNDEGGWRYEPMADDSDMSIVVCQVLALRAARNIGIHVPKSTVDRAARYVADSSIGDDAYSDHPRPYMPQSEVGAFRYQKGSASRSSFPLTAAGVTALYGLGIYSDDKIRAGLDYLQRGMDSFSYRYGEQADGHYFFWYGHYYGVQAMYTAGGRHWETYYDKLRRQLLSMQASDGSFPNAVGPGKPFGTAMAVLILQIPYRFLPIFQR